MGRKKIIKRRKNQMKKTLRLLITCCMLMVLTLSVIFSAGCGAIVHKYDSLVAAYQSAQKAAANGRATLALKYNQVQNYMDMYNAYLAADVAKTEAYRKALANYGAKLAEQDKAYYDANGNPLTPSQIDLNQLVQNQATPTDMALNIYAYVTQFTEAPLAVVDEQSLADTQKYVSETYNEITSAMEDWNTAVQNYNTIRNQASGDIVASAAQALGIKDLPVELPYFTIPIPDQMPSYNNN